MKALTTHQHWHSRWTFIMAATGSAVGLGNIWKFPYIAGENGGGAFVLIYFLCIFVIGVPLLIAETLIGRHGNSNPVDAMKKTARDSDVTKFWAILGVMGALAGLMIMAFYSVVAGWVMDYTQAMARGIFMNADAATAKNYLDNVLMADKERQLIWHTAFTLITVAVLAGGVIKGLGNSVRILMPLLFILLFVSLGYSFQAGDFARGFDFLFTPDFSKVTPQIVLMAMGQAFFTLSLGMGAIMTYGSYMPQGSSIVSTAFIIAFLDTLVAITAGMTVFPLVFAHGIAPSEGAGLMFLSLPLAFGNMSGGVIFGTVFFLLITIAAWSSSISLIEPALAWVSENTPINRALCTFMLGCVVWAGGAACIYIDGIFDQLDNITSNFMLPIGGLLVAIFAGWIMKRKIAKTQLKELSFIQFNLWYACIRVFTPLGVIAVILYSFGWL